MRIRLEQVRFSYGTGSPDQFYMLEVTATEASKNGNERKTRNHKTIVFYSDPTQELLMIVKKKSKPHSVKIKTAL
jgi:hypothetical protein